MIAIVEDLVSRRGEEIVVNLFSRRGLQWLKNSISFRGGKNHSGYSSTPNVVYKMVVIRSQVRLQLRRRQALLSRTHVREKDIIEYLAPIPEHQGGPIPHEGHVPSRAAPILTVGLGDSSKRVLDARGTVDLNVGCPGNGGSHGGSPNASSMQGGRWIST